MATRGRKKITDPDKIKNAHLSIVLSPVHYEKLTRWAKEQKRPRAAMARVLLEAILDEES